MRRHAQLLLPLSALAASGLSLAEDPPSLSDRFAEPAALLYRAAYDSELAYDRLRQLCDEFGHRLAGSPQLERAIDAFAAQMTADGLTVRTEEVMVPVWVRGEERATLLAPVERSLPLLGLGGTPPTPEGGIEAEVVVFESFEAMEAAGREAVEGRIVLFDVPFTTYGETVQYRGHGAARAGALGAAAVLIRSVTPTSLSTPHTGAMRCPEPEEGEDAEVARCVPAAALSLEDAAWLHRLADAGTPLRLRLELSSERREDAPSRNLIAELPGRERPEEIVLLGCHIDSWDVGQGAQDDGAGCMIVWEAARLMAASGQVPRRTVRVVWFTNEENGLRGGFTYAEQHAEELPQHVILIESDTGNGRADGFRLDLSGLAPDDPRRLRAQGLTWQLEALLAPHGGDQWVVGGAGADVWPSTTHGVPGLGVNHDMSTYWPIHHTAADTFDKIVLEDLQHNAGLVAAAAWTLAEMEERLVEPEASGKGKGKRRR